MNSRKAERKNTKENLKIWQRMLILFDEQTKSKLHHTHACMMFDWVTSVKQNHKYFFPSSNKTIEHISCADIANEIIDATFSKHSMFTLHRASFIKKNI